jgi:putative ABC transport system substrate-binding protein
MTGAVAAASIGLSARSGAGQVMPKMLRVGTVSLANPRSAMPFTALDGRFHELGYVEGQNFTLDFIILDGRIEGYSAAMRALVARNADVIVAFGTEMALKAAMAATTQVPIVMVALDYDPLALGHVTSLARPVGNVTGVFIQQIELMVKRMQFLKEAFPDVRAATVFWDGPSAGQWQAAQEVAPSLGLKVAGIKLTDQPYDYDSAFAGVVADYRRMLAISNSPRFFNDRVRIAEFALRNRVATMFAWREWVEVGGLISYGPSFAEVVRRAADYVDRLARGAKPADLPIEQPTRFELVINLKTAKVLGITIPPSLLARADEVIE